MMHMFLILFPFCPQSFDEISPALSPAENVDEEGISPSSPKVNKAIFLLVG